MFNNKEKIRGLPSAVLRRCSSAGQVGTSIDNQGRTIEGTIREFELQNVFSVDLPGVTGSVPGNRDDIDGLVARKKTLNDFKLLLVQDASRFTRAGQGHGQKLLYDLRAAGILVYFVAEDLLVDSEMAEMYASFLFAAARHAVLMLAFNATNGSAASFLADRSPYSKRPPFGLDRMYSDNGVDIHIIRNMPDGTQEQLDPQTLTVIRRFAKNTGKGVPQHYIKQKSETVRLFPGDPRMVAVVHLIFRLHLIDGWSFRQIAMHLNDNGVPSSCGMEWHTTAVRHILLNPVYIGEGIRGRRTYGIYYAMTSQGPKPSEVTLEELANNRRVKGRMRPRDEWLVRPQPQLADFLPEEFRGLARARIEAYLQSIADGKPKKPNRDRHLRSAFLLKDILVSKQGGYKMTGRNGGKDGMVRTYAVSRGVTVPKTGNVLGRRIPAGPLESAVLEMLRHVLLNRAGMEDAIKRLLVEQRRQKSDDRQNGENLQKELLRKRRQLVMLSDGVTLDDDDVLTRKIAAVKAEINALERRITMVQGSTAPRQPLDVGDIAAYLAAELETFGRELKADDFPHIKRLLGLLVRRMEADLETKQVEVEFVVPSWLADAASRTGKVGLDDLFAYKTLIEAHPENGVILMTARCDGSGRPICYTCRRMSLAA